MKPRLAIVYNVRDPAGTGDAEKLLEIQASRESKCSGAVACHELPGRGVLAGYDVEQIYFDFLDSTPDPVADAVVVLSRHTAVSGQPSLTVHHTGNPSSASLGGDPYTLSVSDPPISKALLSNYGAKAASRGLLGEYELTLEATHHGPTRPSKPIVFIEIGSSEPQWMDERAQWAMAEAVSTVLEEGFPDCTPAAGFGDTHYPRKFTEIHLGTEYCMGHIIPKYALKDTRENVIIEAVEKTWPRRAEIAFMQKKSANSEIRAMITRVLEGLGVELKVI